VTISHVDLPVGSGTGLRIAHSSSGSRATMRHAWGWRMTRLDDE
jgi:hypothetical protein